MADENLGRGPSALGPVSSDIDELTIEVYKYSATIKTATLSTGNPRSTPGDQAKFCTSSFSANELTTAREIAQHLQTIRSRLSGIVDGAAARAQADSATAGKDVQDRAALLEDAVRRGNKAGARQFWLQEQAAVSAQVLADRNTILIRRRGADLAATLDGLLAEVNSVIGLLGANWNAWVVAGKECGDWQAYFVSP